MVFQEYKKCCNSLRNNLSNIEMLVQLRQATQLKVIQENVFKITSRKHQQWRDIPQWNQFEKAHSEIRARYPFLVLEGKSQTAKSSYAFWRLGDPSKVCFCPCANAEEPDLRNFDYFAHKVIVLDEADAELIIRKKDMMQASPWMVRMGTSRTNCNSYEVYLHNVMLIVCSNKWAEQLELLAPSDRDWIESNQIYYFCGDQPMFVTDAELAFM